MSAYLNAIGTAVPDQDVHQSFIGWAGSQLVDATEQKLFARMARRSGIAHRWSVLPSGPEGGSPVDTGGFYHGEDPGTAARMALYARHAPVLAQAAVRALGDAFVPQNITHMMVASCTGFMAPGLDQVLAKMLGIRPTVERQLVGFMGCYGAIAALRAARHIVRSQPDAQVLLVCVELSSLHLQRGRDLEGLLAMLQFGDGAGAAVISANADGLQLGTPFCTTLPDSEALIQWHVGDHGFEMILSGEVPGQLAHALAQPSLLPVDPRSIDAWAIHPGGRSILDAVEHGLTLPEDALADSRGVLNDHGNMSSATLMFVLERMMRRRADQLPRRALALAFGPGVAAEGMLLGADGELQA